MERNYLATYGTGHDYGSFEYESCYRNNSKKNLEDAYRKMKHKYGKKYKIIKTVRYGE